MTGPIPLDTSLPLDDQSTAAHELGHAIVMRSFGFVPSLIRIHPWLGGGYCESETRIETWQNLRDYGVTLVAGYEAEQHWRGLRELSAASSMASWADMSEFWRARRELHQNQDEIRIQENAARAEAREILLEHWEELERLVPELVHETTLKKLETP